MTRPPIVSGSVSGTSDTMIVGIYGLPGAGKSHLLRDLGDIVGDDYLCFEGAEEVARVAGGDLQHFHSLDSAAQADIRRQAISNLRDTCSTRGKLGIVAGHFMLWSYTEQSPVSISTDQDLRCLTHIIYLDTDAEVIAHRCRTDTMRNRGSLSVEQITQWQVAEKVSLRDACYRHHILFIALNIETTNAEHVTQLLASFKNYNLRGILEAAETRLHKIIGLRKKPTKSVLVFDGDRTLSPLDTGALVWNHGRVEQADTSPLTRIFQSPLGYSPKAFLQAAALHHEAFTPDTLNTRCEDIAQRVDLYPQISVLLQELTRVDHSCAIVVTCGLQILWEKILRRHGFPSIHVIGAGRLGDLVVDPDVKASLVTMLREAYGVRVTAFGDSPVDLQMLSRADRAIIVVGDEMSRSNRMDLELGLAIHDGLLKAEQAVLVDGASPRLDTGILPLVSLADSDFLHGIFSERPQLCTLRVAIATRHGAARLLSTAMRDANFNGPALRQAHRRAGWYLAIEMLPDLLGTEEFDMLHVQGHTTQGHRLKNERTILIVALMRGGEPMAMGVSEALPLAGFLHARKSDDITMAYLSSASTVILVDSVINNGHTMVEFVEKVHALRSSIRIVMLVGVVQSAAVNTLKGLAKELHDQSLALVALRSSDNKFTGRGATDTGHRLFNTAYLD